jgi:hypothetical protein
MEIELQTFLKDVWKHRSIPLTMIQKYAHIEVPGVSASRSMLHYAARARNVSVMETLMEAGVDPNNVRDGKGAPPLFCAVEYSSVDTVDIDSKEQPCLSTIKCLLDHKADINAVDSNGENALPILLLSSYFDETVFSFLIAHGAAPSLHAFVSGNSKDFTAYFVDHEVLWQSARAVVQAEEKFGRPLPSHIQTAIPRVPKVDTNADDNYDDDDDYPLANVV